MIEQCGSGTRAASWAAIWQDPKSSISYYIVLGSTCCSCPSLVLARSGCASPYIFQLRDSDMRQLATIGFSTLASPITTKPIPGYWLILFILVKISSFLGRAAGGRTLKVQCANIWYCKPPPQFYVKDLTYSASCPPPPSPCAYSNSCTPVHAPGPRLPSAACSNATARVCGPESKREVAPAPARSGTMLSLPLNIVQFVAAFKILITAPV